MGSSGSSKITLADTLAVFDAVDSPCTPLTASEVAEGLECTRRTAHRKLEQLAERGEVRTKKTGARSRVWWRPPAASERRPPAGSEPADAASSAGADGEPISPEGSTGSRTHPEAVTDFIREVQDYAIFTLDPEGYVASWNQGAARIKGYAAEEIIGEHFSTFYTDADRAAAVPEENLEAARQHGRTEDEGWRRRAYGTEFWADVVITAIRAEDGSLRGFTKVTRDLTERREYEQRLERERAQTEELLRTAPIAISVQDDTGETIRANERAQSLLGLSEEEIIEDPTDLEEWTLYDADGEEIDRSATPSTRVIETGEPVYEVEYAIEDPDGDRTWLSVSAAPITDDDGELQRVVTAAEDITELKRRERELQSQKAELETELGEILDRVSDAFYALDDEWCFTHVNDRAEALIDRESEELLGRSIWSILPDAEDDEFGERLREAMDTQESAAFEVYSEDGGYWLEITAYPSPTGVSVYFRDVTDRVEREHELERYEAIVETVPDGVYTVDGEGRFTMVNQAYAQQTGYSREELLGAHVSKVVDTDTIEKARSVERELTEGGLDTARIEADVMTADGGRFRGEATFGLLPGEGGHRVSVVRDITERAARERELTEYRRLVETVDDGVYVLDAEGFIRRVNEAFVSMTRYDRETLVGTHASAVFGEQFEAHDVEARQRFEAGETVVIFEEEIHTASGDAIVVESRFQEYEQPDGTGRVGVVRDVTERKERERELERAHDLLERTERIADVGGWEVRPETREVFWSEHLFEILGVSGDEEPTLEEALDVYLEADRPIIQGAIQEALEAGEPFDVEVRFRRPEGEVRWLRVLGKAETVEGEVVSLRGAAQDVTERKERERELRRFETLIEESTDVNAILDRDGTIRYITPSVEFVLGYTREEIEGRNALELVHPDDREHTTDALVELATEEGSRPKIEFRARHADGSWVWIESRGRNLTDEPMIDGLVVYTRDVTDRKEYARELETRANQQQVVSELGKQALETDDVDELFATAVRKVADTLDNEYCKVLDLDDAGERLLLRQGVGWDDGLVGEASVSATDDESQAAYTLASEQPVVVTDLASETRFSGPALLTDHDVTSGISTIIGSYEEPWGILGTHDTAEKSPSPEDVAFVRSVANILAEAIEREAYEDELETLVAELEESNERLEQFAYAASHDLQEPLRMISNYLQLIEQRYAGELDGEADEFIEFAVDGADRMRAMINDLLAYSRVGTEAVPVETVDTNDVVERVLGDLQMRIAESDARIDVEPLPAVRADPNQLEQVFQNLLTNALKYHEEGVPPSVEIGAERRGDEWVFSVADEGLGIDPEHTDRIFEVFKRLHPTDEYGGTGVGLALVQKIVERHGGEIWLESEAGEGSTFYVSFPAAPDEPGRAGSPPAVPSPEVDVDD